MGAAGAARLHLSSRVENQGCAAEPRAPAPPRAPRSNNVLHACPGARCVYGLVSGQLS